MGYASISIVVLVAGGGFFWLAALLEGPEDALVTVDVPIIITQGDTATLTIEIENLASETQTLDSVDIDQSYLDGIVAVASDPAYQSVESFDLVIPFQSYYFDHTLPANETLTVEVELQAVRVGDFSGELSVCINGITTCTTHQLRTVVEEP